MGLAERTAHTETNLEEKPFADNIIRVVTCPGIDARTLHGEAGAHGEFQGACIGSALRPESRRRTGSVGHADRTTRKSRSATRLSDSPLVLHQSLMYTTLDHTSERRFDPARGEARQVR